MDQEADKTRVFISYAHFDEKIARKIHADLKRAGLKPWLDKIDLIPGQKWKPAITNAIKNSRYFVALLSSDSVRKKGFVQTELKRAMEVFNRFCPSFQQKPRLNRRTG